MPFEVPKLSALSTQPQVRDLLLGVTISNRAPSYLFAGPSGCGKATHALSLVKTLFCERGGDCPGCPSCRQVASHSHPDLIWVDRAYVAAHTKGEGKTLTINVESIQTLCGALQSAPFTAPLRAAIIPDADLMNEKAQDVLLKTLEEPSPKALLILTAERPARLKPTILSRCRTVRFAPVAAEALERALVDSHGFDGAAAKEAARWADGDLDLALRHANAEWRAFRQGVSDDFDGAVTGSARDWLSVSSKYDKIQWDPEDEEEMTDAQRRRRSVQETLKILLQLWSRRMHGRIPIPDALRRLPPEKVLEALQRHLEALEGNLPSRMVLDHLVLVLREGAATGEVETRSFFDLAVQ